ncbi:alanyl-tRNA editing protein [Cytobacillus purgationiresistens]|uniref:Alanyl-tRNA synthetase n=1 Tax=Cytobacillus purgationiresistens TaxID=863449 RepID=A0ABU0AJD7_9BACI|nr:DHHA1 domain-containing protein [Cytobacillus purgationiresistens]MDQ0270528.1 alanyl-tRNA synthetase [Cytobacillus purgationiresistens]
MQKLYYNDAYIKTFQALLQNQQEDEEGRLYAVLNQTGFYPTGGGQPHDTGELNGARVTDVEEVEGEIRHYIDTPIQENEVTGVIDWDRRLDHMQQHAGQHILSAAFAETLGVITVGFHLGKELVTIDLDTKELSEEQAAEAEERANQIILENRPIELRWVDAADLDQYPLRKQPTVQENIRLVIIPEFDYNGCGGTHPSTTGQVSAIKILDWERQKKQTRLTFVCGGRVLTQLHKKHTTVKQVSQLLSASEEELAKATARMIAHSKSVEKELEDARNELLNFEGVELLKEVSLQGESKVLGKIFQNRSIQELQNLARQMTAEAPEAIIFLINESDEKLQFVCARGSEPGFSMKEIVAELLLMIDGRGGGNEKFAQGGGEASVSSESLLDKALSYVI